MKYFDINFSVELREVSKIDNDFSAISWSRGEFSVEVTRYRYKIVGFFLSILERVSTNIILVNILNYWFLRLNLYWL